MLSYLILAAAGVALFYKRDMVRDYWRLGRQEAHRRAVRHREQDKLDEDNALLAFYPGRKRDEIDHDMYVSYLRERARLAGEVANRSRMQLAVYEARKRAAKVDPLADRTISGGRVVGHCGRVISDNINNLSGPERETLVAYLRNGYPQN